MIIYLEGKKHPTLPKNARSAKEAKKKENPWASELTF